MDYTKQPLLFKARKGARYVRLYGVDRTAVKVRSYYHMRRRYRTLPALPAAREEDPGRHVGLIGCGKFGYAVIAYYLSRRHGKVIRSAMDVDVHRAASLARRYDLARYSDDAAAVLDDPLVDLVYVASNHASHADYAIRALERGKHVHIEKPHVVSDEQLDRLCAAMAASPGKVRLGFNRPLSPLGRDVAAALQAQPAPLMLDWFVVGHEIPPGHWYHDAGEGGRVLGNLPHWTDHVLRLIPEERRYPLRIHPVRGGETDSDVVVSYAFGDGSVATITFLAPQGHAFEGVRERLSAHGGDTLIGLEDFQRLTVERGRERTRRRLRHRDHGHERMVLESYAMARGGPGETVRHVRETGELFLRTRDALESGEVVTLPAAPDPAPAALSA